MKLFTRTGKATTRNNKGFTLIEVIIVIVLVGSLMAFLVPRLMSTGKENSAKSSANAVIEDMRQINEAAQMYATNKSAEITATGDIASKLVANNLISSVPAPNTSYQDTTYTGAAPYSYVVDNATVYAGLGTGAADTVLTLTGVTKDVCIKINDAFGVGVTGATPSATFVSGKDPQCYGSGAAAVGYIVVKAVHPH